MDGAAGDAVAPMQVDGGGAGGHAAGGADSPAPDDGAAGAPETQRGADPSQGGSQRPKNVKFTKAMSKTLAELAEKRAVGDAAFKTRRLTAQDLSDISKALEASLPAGDEAHRALARTLTRVREALNTARERLGWKHTGTKKAAQNAKAGVRQRSKAPKKPKVSREDREAALASRVAKQRAELDARAALTARAQALIASWNTELKAAAAPYVSGERVVASANADAVATLVQQLQQLRAEASSMHGVPAAVDLAVAVERALASMADRNPAQQWAAQLLTARTVAATAPHVAPLAAALAAAKGHSAPAPRGPRRGKADVPPAGRNASRAVGNYLSRAVDAMHEVVLKGSAAGAGVLSCERAGVAAAAFAAREAAAAAAAEVHDPAAPAALDAPALPTAAQFTPTTLAGGAALFFHMAPGGTATIQGENLPAHALPALKLLLMSLAGAPQPEEGVRMRERRARRPAERAQRDAAVAEADALGARWARAPDPTAPGGEGCCRYCKEPDSEGLTACKSAGCALSFHHRCAAAVGWEHLNYCCEQCVGAESD